MKKYGLIGHPLSHSFSKRYFTEKFESENLVDCRFDNYDIEDINQLKNLLTSNPELRGLCVTIPHKQSIISLLDESNDAVKDIGACNSVKIEDGKLYGYNTDCIGFEQSLTKKLLPHHQKALILGTGGSSRAVSFVLNQINIDHLLVSRNSDEDLKIINYESINKEIVSQYQLIINCSPVGMYPNINEAPNIPYENLSADHFLFDLTYNPEETLFLKKGRAHGAMIQNGYDMLVYQAEASWKIWNENT